LTLRLRIALVSAAAVAIAIAIAAWIAFSATERELIAEVDASLYDRVERIEQVDNLFELIAVLNPFESRIPSEPFSRGVRGFDAIFWQYVPGERSPAITDYPGEGGLPVGPAERAVINGDAAVAIRTVDVGDDNLRLLTSALPTGAIQVARSLAEVDSSLEGLAAVLRFAAVIGVLLAGAVGFFVARGAVRPIGELAAAAEHVAATQELAARIDVDRSDEIGRLAGSFNAMLAALEGSRRQQRRLVRDAGHELRTPLTALRTNVELLARVDDLPADERARMLEDIESEIGELSLLVTELVELAAEPSAAASPREEVDLGEIAARVTEKFRRRTDRDIRLVADEATVLGNPAQLERAISNLIDNAHKWSPPGAAIDVEIQQGRVVVADQGPGIEEADRPFVFDRFYRSAQARATPGSGLGLSIVAKVAEDHGGTAFVGDSASGASVGFSIPALPDVADRQPSTSGGNS
jgi:two-component system sensor histidine kinase MprB